MNNIDSYITRSIKIASVTITVLSAVYFLVLLPLKELQDTTETIKNNHLVHLSASIERLEQGQKEQGLLLEKIKTILELHRVDKIEK